MIVKIQVPLGGTHGGGPLLVYTQNKKQMWMIWPALINPDALKLILASSRDTMGKSYWEVLEAKGDMGPLTLVKQVEAQSW